MKIRLADKSEIDTILSIFEAARTFMRTNGNQTQWTNGYPQKELMLDEIESKHCYVCLNEEMEIVGTFCYIEGIEPTYDYIENGEWLNDEPYATIHRVASNGKVRGILEICLDWSFTQKNNIRIDTHEDNTLMRNKVINYGFTTCGIIYVGDGTPRIAYQKIIK